MFDQNADRGSPSALKGLLSDIYYPSLLETSERDKSIDALAQRLGAKATVDDPLFGRATALAALKELLGRTSKWLEERRATYERVAATTGIDRDVTEGKLALTLDGKTLDLPVAVVAEKRRSREVELRIYFASQAVTGKSVVRAPLVPADTETALPQVVADHLDALHKGDPTAALACFQADGGARDARGVEHAKAGDLKSFYERRFNGSGLAIERGATADDGRTCAIEYSLSKVAGRDVPPQAVLAVYERGDSGLLRAIRLYDDIAI